MENCSVGKFDSFTLEQQIERVISFISPAGGAVALLWALHKKATVLNTKFASAELTKYNTQNATNNSNHVKTWESKYITQ